MPKPAAPAAAGLPAPSHPALLATQGLAVVLAVGSTTAPPVFTPWLSVGAAGLMAASLVTTWRRPTASAARAPADTGTLVGPSGEAHPLARVSHDLKTPLAGIVGLCDGILRSKLAAEQADAVRLVRSSAGVAIGMVDDLLDSEVARVGPLILRPSGFTPAALLEECAGLIEPLAREKGLALRYLASESLAARLRGDGLRIRQVVLNLLSNAVRYTSRGQVRLDARSTLRPFGQGIELEVEVTDTGHGISKEAQAALFAAPNWSEGRTAGTGGTGLGLYICRLVVERMGGKITCESSLGQGSTFHFSVPLELAGQLTPPSVPPLRRAALRLRERPPRRALVVEDDPVSRRVAVRLFAAVGVTADAGADVASARSLYDPLRHEVVLIDLNLPDGTGRDLAHDLHRLSPAGLEPLFLATSTIGPREHQALASLDDIFQQFLAKPISLPQLREAIAENFLLAEAAADQSETRLGAPAATVSPAATAEPAVVDDDRWQVLAALDLDGRGVSLIDELIEALEGEARAALEQCLRLASADRVEGVGEPAHRLRSAALNLGALRLEREARAIEKAGALGDVADVQSALERTAAAAESALRELRSRRAQDSGRHVRGRY